MKLVAIQFVYYSFCLVQVVGTGESYTEYTEGMVVD